MIYFDTSYIVRLYLEDPGWEAVRALAATAPVACCVHGRAEAVAAFHRKLREGVLAQQELRVLMGQFDQDCAEQGFRWLPLSEAVVDRLSRTYRDLRPSVHLRAADSVHLACAAENGFKEIYSNDKRLLAGARYFGLHGRDVM